VYAVRYATPKLPSATSFIRKTLYEIARISRGKYKYSCVIAFECAGEKAFGVWKIKDGDLLG